MFVRLTLFLFLFTAVLASSLSLGFAQQKLSEFGHITALETGHVGATSTPDDTMSVILDVPPVNSGVLQFSTSPTTGGPRSVTIVPCQITNAGYGLDPKDPGVKVHEAALLGAFFAREKVRVLVDGCIYDKPRIIAVGIVH
jgi:hypothetical protein